MPCNSRKQCYTDGKLTISIQPETSCPCLSAKNDAVCFGYPIKMKILDAMHGFSNTTRLKNNFCSQLNNLENKCEI